MLTCNGLLRAERPLGLTPSVRVLAPRVLGLDEIARLAAVHLSKGTSLTDETEGGLVRDINRIRMRCKPSRIKRVKSPLDARRISQTTSFFIKRSHLCCIRSHAAVYDNLLAYRGALLPYLIGHKTTSPVECNGGREKKGFARLQIADRCFVSLPLISSSASSLTSDPT